MQQTEEIDVDIPVMEVADLEKNKDLEETSVWEENGEVPNEEEEDISCLRARIAQLETELMQRDELACRMTREFAEFERYFPEVSLRELPDHIWEQVHRGVPLAAAYALYERGLANEKKRIEEQKAHNMAHTAGVPSSSGATYFSPAQVRAMSRDEVREHYDRIFESMRHWQ